MHILDPTCYVPVHYSTDYATTMSCQIRRFSLRLKNCAALRTSNHLEQKGFKRFLSTKMLRLWLLRALLEIGRQIMERDLETVRASTIDNENVICVWSATKVISQAPLSSGLSNYQVAAVCHQHCRVG